MSLFPRNSIIMFYFVFIRPNTNVRTIYHALSALPIEIQIAMQDIMIDVYANTVSSKETNIFK